MPEDNSFRALPEISIIIPAFNSEEKIERAIDSCLALEDLSVEIIVIDDGSTDKTLEKIARFSSDTKVKIHRLGKNCGVSFARNFGIEKSKSKHIMFLDSDDYYLPSAGKKISNAIVSYPDLEIYCFGYLINGKLSPVPKNRPLHMEFISGKFSNTNTIVCKRELFYNNKFSESHRIGEDTLLWFTLLCRHSAAYFPSNIAFYDYTPKINFASNHPLLSLDLESLGLSKIDQEEVRRHVTKDQNMRRAFSRSDSLLGSYRNLGLLGIAFWIIGPKFFPRIWKLKRALTK